MTMTLVATYEVGAGGAASIEFTSIPQDADDLLLVLSARIITESANARTVIARFNGDSGTNYSYRRLSGNGSSAASASSTTETGIFGLWATATISTADTFASGTVYVPNYTSSATKSASVDSVTENNATSAQQAITASLWNNTAAVTSITVLPTAFSFAQHSTASLYKVTKA